MAVIGRHCNRKYRAEMENILTVVEESQKKLSRPIKDLDDIRIAMAALKEIREQQISTDFQVGPIEVDGQPHTMGVNGGALWSKSCHTVASFQKHEILCLVTLR